MKEANKQNREKRRSKERAEEGCSSADNDSPLDIIQELNGEHVDQSNFDQLVTLAEKSIKSRDLTLRAVRRRNLRVENLDSLAHVKCKAYVFGPQPESASSVSELKAKLFEAKEKRRLGLFLTTSVSAPALPDLAGVVENAVQFSSIAEAEDADRLVVEKAVEAQQLFITPSATENNIAFAALQQQKFPQRQPSRERLLDSVHGAATNVLVGAKRKSSDLTRDDDQQSPATSGQEPTSDASSLAKRKLNSSSSLPPDQNTPTNGKSKTVTPQTSSATTISTITMSSSTTATTTTSSGGTTSTTAERSSSERRKMPAGSKVRFATPPVSTTTAEHLTQLESKNQPANAYHQNEKPASAQQQLPPITSFEPETANVSDGGQQHATIPDRTLPHAILNQPVVHEVSIDGPLALRQHQNHQAAPAVAPKFDDNKQIKKALENIEFCEQRVREKTITLRRQQKQESIDRSTDQNDKSAAKSTEDLLPIKSEAETTNTAIKILSQTDQNSPSFQQPPPPLEQRSSSGSRRSKHHHHHHHSHHHRHSSGQTSSTTSGKNPPQLHAPSAVSASSSSHSAHHQTIRHSTTKVHATPPTTLPTHQPYSSSTLPKQHQQSVAARKSRKQRHVDTTDTTTTTADEYPVSSRSTPKLSSVYINPHWQSNSIDRQQRRRRSPATGGSTTSQRQRPHSVHLPPSSHPHRHKRGEPRDLIHSDRLTPRPQPSHQQVAPCNCCYNYFSQFDFQPTQLQAQQDQQQCYCCAAAAAAAFLHCQLRHHHHNQQPQQHHPHSSSSNNNNNLLLQRPDYLTGNSAGRPVETRFSPNLTSPITQQATANELLAAIHCQSQPLPQHHSVEQACQHFHCSNTLNPPAPPLLMLNSSSGNNNTSKLLPPPTLNSFISSAHQHQPASLQQQFNQQEQRTNITPTPTTATINEHHSKNTTTQLLNIDDKNKLIMEHYGLLHQQQQQKPLPAAATSLTAGVSSGSRSSGNSTGSSTVQQPAAAAAAGAVNPRAFSQPHTSIIMQQQQQNNSSFSTAFNEMAVDVPETWRGASNNNNNNQTTRHFSTNSFTNNTPPSAVKVDAVEMHDLSPTTFSPTHPQYLSAASRSFSRTPLRDSKKLMALTEQPNPDQIVLTPASAFINNAFERDHDYAVHNNNNNNDSNDFHSKDFHSNSASGAYDVLQQIINHFQNSMKISEKNPNDAAAETAAQMPNSSTAGYGVDALQHLAHDPVTSAALKIYQLMVSSPSNTSNARNNEPGDLYAQVRHIVADCFPESDESSLTMLSSSIAQLKTQNDLNNNNGSISSNAVHQKELKNSAAFHRPNFANGNQQLNSSAMPLTMSTFGQQLPAPTAGQPGSRLAGTSSPNFISSISSNFPQISPYAADSMRSPRLTAAAASTVSSPPVYRIVQIEKGNDPLGATIRAENDQIVIGRVVHGGIAKKSGALHEGDVICSVNGVDLYGKTVDDVVGIIQSISGQLQFVIAPAARSELVDAGQPSTSSGTTGRNRNVANNMRDSIHAFNTTNPAQPPNFEQQQILHVRAHFNYEPDEDAYIPCKELGLSFSCGDILHVLDQSDPCWWQAYRDDFDGSSSAQATATNDETGKIQQVIAAQLAGLIPSFQFQQQREQLRRSLLAQQSGTEGGSRPGYATIGGGQRPFDTMSTSASGYSSKSLKRTTFGGGSEGKSTGKFGKKQSRNSSLRRDSEIEEFQPYEEVGLLYPRSDTKRPIVLIGPPSVGRKELRESLMKSDANNMFMPAVPHTTRSPRPGELNGVVYHFLQHRKEFEDGIMRNKFVEHGEFEKQLYGTSFDAVRQILSRGKYCVLNLLPQSITALRASDLRPFVVFIAPPPIDKLRFNLMSRGIQMKDDELRAIIEEAREMEAIYGHLFDRVIVHTSFEQAYLELRDEIYKLENEPQWVSACWLR